MMAAASVAGANIRNLQSRGCTCNFPHDSHVPSLKPAMFTISRSTRIILLLVLDVIFFFVELIVGQFFPTADQELPHR